MSVRSGIAAIRAARKLVPVGDDPLKGPWRILSTSGDYSHELHLDPAGVVVCSTCRSKYGRGQCWATERVRLSLGQAKPPEVAAEPEPAVGSLSWRQVVQESAERQP